MRIPLFIFLNSIYDNIFKEYTKEVLKYFNLNRQFTKLQYTILKILVDITTKMMTVTIYYYSFRLIDKYIQKKGRIVNK